MASPYSTAFITMALMIISSAVLTVGDDTDPVFSVENATVKAFNLTSDNRLFCFLIISLQSSIGGSFLSYGPIKVNVDKSENGGRLADDVVVMGNFSQPPWSDTLIAVEAVGLYRQLGRTTADQIRAEFPAGFVRVNVRASVSLDSRTTVDVTCWRVEVHFASSEEFRKVACNVNVNRQWNNAASCGMC